MLINWREADSKSFSHDCLEVFINRFPGEHFSFLFLLSFLPHPCHIRITLFITALFRLLESAGEILYLSCRPNLRRQHKVLLRGWNAGSFRVLVIPWSPQNHRTGQDPVILRQRVWNKPMVITYLQRNYDESRKRSPNGKIIVSVFFTLYNL